jgi:hypothetical protein
MGLDIASTLTGASTELTADDLIGGPRLLRITRLEMSDDKKRPLSIFYNGDEGRPWRPCLMMRRVLVGCFGTNSDDFIGQTVEVYRDNSVTYGAKGEGLQQVGGVRLKRASIKERMSFNIQAKRGQKIPYIVNPIPQSELPRQDRIEKILKAIASMPADGLPAAQTRADELLSASEISAEGHGRILAAIEARSNNFTTATTP